MAKYIDADKLIALIDAKLEDLGLSGSVWVGRSVLQDLKGDIITFLQQEQQEVDLEEEIQEYIQKLGFGYGGWVDGLSDEDLKHIACYFYELGKLNARKGEIDL